LWGSRGRPIGPLSSPGASPVSSSRSQGPSLKPPVSRPLFRSPLFRSRLMRWMRSTAKGGAALVRTGVAGHTELNDGTNARATSLSSAGVPPPLALASWEPGRRDAAGLRFPEGPMDLLASQWARDRRLPARLAPNRSLARPRDEQALTRSHQSDRSARVPSRSVYCRLTRPTCVRANSYRLASSNSTAA
jgi:hypothetical protein